MGGGSLPLKGNAILAGSTLRRSVELNTSPLNQVHHTVWWARRETVLFNRRRYYMSKLNVLVIDDDPCFMPLLFQNYGTSSDFVFATTETEMEEQLKRQKSDVILMDGSLLGWRRGLSEGADVVRMLRSRGLTTAIIMFSGEDKRNEAGMMAGANAVWSKDNLYEKEVKITLLATIAAVRDIRILRGIG